MRRLVAATQKTIVIRRGQAEAARLLVEIADRIPVGVSAMAKAQTNASATATLAKGFP